VFIVQGRIYEKKKQMVAKFIREHAKVDHLVILNEVNIDYDTLMKIISELHQEGLLK
jgi:predicted transcriptional regulator